MDTTLPPLLLSKILGWHAATAISASLSFQHPIVVVVVDNNKGNWQELCYFFHRTQCECVSRWVSTLRKRATVILFVLYINNCCRTYCSSSSSHKYNYSHLCSHSYQFFLYSYQTLTLPLWVLLILHSFFVSLILKCRHWDLRGIVAFWRQHQHYW